jgi:hypothetical protein
LSRESFRKDLQRALDQMTGSPSSSLSDRVRSAVDQAPEERAPMWIAGAAAVLVAAIVIGLLVIGNPFKPPTVGVGPGPTPSARPSPSPSPTPSVQFDCVDQTQRFGPQAPPTAFITAVRTGTHAGYDRITFEFKDTLPGIVELHPQSNARFTHDASGQMETIAGTFGLRIVFRGADEHSNYSGATDFKSSYADLKEAKAFGDFEGVVTWGVGLAKPACFHVSTLTNPARLVIDLQNS